MRRFCAWIVALCLPAVALGQSVGSREPPAFTLHPVYLQADTKPPAAPTSSDEGELAKKLSNPISSLISVPFQSNFDFNQGPDNDRWKYTLNVQPVIPIDLNKDFNLIARFIVPVIYQEKLADGLDSNFGLGDTQGQFFFTPKKEFGGWMIGAGPVVLLPTATDTALGAGKWGIGPTAVALKQDGPWTYGVLANHVWSFAGDDDRGNVNTTFIQPFLAYNTKTGTGLTLQAESTYNWNTDQWTIPVGVFVSQVFKVSGQAMSFNVGPRYYVEGPSGGPEWGIRFTITFLFPK